MADQIAGVGADGNARVYDGQAFHLVFQLTANGLVQLIGGRSFALSFRKNRLTTGVIDPVAVTAPDGADQVALTIPATDTPAIVAALRSAAGLCEVSEVFAASAKPLMAWPVLTGASADLSSVEPGEQDAPGTLVRYDVVTGVVSVSQTGPQGWSAAQQVARARPEELADATDAAFAAWLVTKAAEAAADAIANAGTATGAANDAATYAKGQGDYAKAQGAAAKGVVDQQTTTLAQAIQAKTDAQTARDAAAGSATGAAGSRDAAAGSAGSAAGSSTIAAAQAALVAMWAALVQTIANTGVGKVLPTWPALAAITGNANDGAIVPDTDTGTHTDPVSGTTVPNGGTYRWSPSPAGWQRVAASTAAQVQASVNQVQDLRTFFTRTGNASGYAGAGRFRIGNRLYASWDSTIGFYFRKLRLPAGATVDDALGLTLAQRLLTSPVGAMLRRPGVEMAPASSALRVKIGNRLYATMDAAAGFWPRKLTLPSTAKLDDGTGLLARLLAANVSDKLRPMPLEISRGLRFRIGNRLLATVDLTRGLYPRRATLPAGTRVDDDLATDLVSRLVGAGVGLMLRRLPGETGGPFRIRWNNRLLAIWTKAGGIQFARQTLPADVKIADQPGTNLADRLGGGGSAVATAAYVVEAAPDSAGKLQITSRRRSDSKRFVLTSGATSSREPSIAPEGNRVLYWSDADVRAMHQPIEGGIAWPVNPYALIEAWGDSLTLGVGAVAGKDWPTQLGAMTGATAPVSGHGSTGQLSAEIAARQGGQPATLSVANNSIPASGAVTVTAYSVDLLFLSPLSGYLTLTGTLAGVPGTLSGNATNGRGTATYTFTRTTAGAAVACPAGTPFIPDLGAASRPRVQILTYGRNDGVSNAGVSAILSALAASVAYQTAYVPRFLVGGVLAGPGETLAPFNSARDQLAAAYGARFVDLNAVPTTEEMAKIGFVPDSYGTYANGRTDAQDLAAGYIPSGMRASAPAGTSPGGTDFLHLNPYGYALWALRYYRAIVSMGWWPTLPTV